MHRVRVLPGLVLSLLLGASLGGCAEDDEPEAERIGVGAQCLNTDQCESYADTDGADVPLSCLSQFVGGYCGIIDCRGHDDCPEGSACVRHDDGFRYCFRLCSSGAECNESRNAEHEATCSADVTWVGDELGMACVPPEST